MKINSPTTRLAPLLAACCLCSSVSGCGEDGAASDPPLQEPCEELGVKPPEPLRWRRHELLLGELSRALELPHDDLCTELGSVQCGDIHKVALGGNNPFEETMYEPAASPLPVTPTTIDRVVLSACMRRVAADVQGPAVVFDEIDLASASVDPSDEQTRSQVVSVFRRIHSRDPEEEEVELVSTLAVGATAQEFAVLACFAVAGTSEMVLI